jgi:methionyl-tRNA formyltransferase
MVRELDAGDMLLAKAIPIAADETGGSLHDRLAVLAADLLTETLGRIADGTTRRVPHDPALASYVPKLERGDGWLDWALPAAALERRIRAYEPWPGTFTTASEGGASRRLKILPPTRVLAVGPEPGRVSCADASRNAFVRITRRADRGLLRAAF